MSSHSPVQGINGRTRIVPILAYPSAHVRTPGVFNARCVARGLDALCVPWQVAPEHLGMTWEALRRADNVAGVIVTVPHKGSVATLCDALTGEARLLAVANVARRDAGGRFTGAMFDGVGYIAGLRARGIEVAGRRVLLIGAGGVATAMAGAFAGAGAADLAIANRDAAKAERLAALIHAAHPRTRVRAAAPDPAGYDLVVNGTSLGLRPDDPLPVDPTRMDAGTIVAEVVMQPAVTPLLQAAAARGLRIHEGEHMLTAQIDLLIDFLLGDAR